LGFWNGQKQLKKQKKMVKNFKKPTNFDILPLYISTSSFSSVVLKKKKANV